MNNKHADRRLFGIALAVFALFGMLQMNIFSGANENASWRNVQGTHAGHIEQEENCPSCTDAAFAVSVVCSVAHCLAVLPNVMTVAFKPVPVARDDRIIHVFTGLNPVPEPHPPQHLFV
jgi:hypothetical protein